VVLVVCRDGGIALVRVFVVVWEVSEEVRGDRRWFGEREQRETFVFWSTNWWVLVVRREVYALDGAVIAK
jgi:hypothetical protein